jgi:hypothetical protein
LGLGVDRSGWAMLYKIQLRYVITNLAGRAMPALGFARVEQERVGE